MGRHRSRTIRGRRSECASQDRGTQRSEKRVEYLQRKFELGCPNCGCPEAPPVCEVCEECGLSVEEFLKNDG